MKGTELIIKFIKDKAFISYDKPLSLNQADLRSIIEFYSTEYWRLRVLGYKPDEKRIFVEVLSYDIGECDFNDNQKKLVDMLNEIDFIKFKDIKTEKLLGKARFVNPQKAINSGVTNPQKEFIKTVENESFSVPIKDIEFKFGYVAFKKDLKECNKKVEIQIQNPDIREEFDAIKNYFAKALKTKKIQATVTYKVVSGEISIIQAKSPEIDRVKELIGEVRFDLIKTLIRKNIVGADKSLFTMDECFKYLIDENIESNLFYNSEKEFLEDLTQIVNTKHYKQLRFLSSKHCYEVVKLRFTQKPFSCIFIVQGKSEYYIIWETLDTEEATYIWLCKKEFDELKIMLREIENSIAVMRTQGKADYIKNNNSVKRIFHDYSDVVSGFLKWKEELENIIKLE